MGKTETDAISRIQACLPEKSVPIIEVATALGFKVFEHTLGDATSGVLDFQKREITIEDTTSEERRRLICAHLIEEFFKTPNRDVPYVLGWSWLHDEVEKDGGSMAAEILMPKSIVKMFYEDGMSTEEMAQRFKVTVRSVLHRINYWKQNEVAWHKHS